MTITISEIAAAAAGARAAQNIALAKLLDDCAAALASAERALDNMTEHANEIDQRRFVAEESERPARAELAWIKSALTERLLWHANNGCGCGWCEKARDLLGVARYDTLYAPAEKYHSKVIHLMEWEAASLNEQKAARKDVSTADGVTWHSLGGNTPPEQLKRDL